MIDDKTMRSMLEGMETAAEEALRGDPAFHETLRSLKAEIDRDPRVQSIVNRLHAVGSRVFSSLIPRIKIRIRTSAGEISLPERHRNAAGSPTAVAQLTQELKSAASSVIMRGRYREVLDHIMNDAVGASDRFEGIAAELERAGHEIVICLDLSAYAQVRELAVPAAKARNLLVSGEPLAHLLSRQDLQFLKDLKISAGEN
jgi:hypothetical protein